MLRFRTLGSYPNKRKSNQTSPLTLREELPMTDEHIDTLLQEVQWVRKLLMLQTLALGYKQKHLAAALGVSNATVSRMMPKGFAKETASARGAAFSVED